MCIAIVIFFSKCGETYRHDLRCDESVEICSNMVNCRLDLLDGCNQQFCGAMYDLEDKTYNLGCENGCYYTFVFGKR